MLKQKIYFAISLPSMSEVTKNLWSCLSWVYEWLTFPLRITKQISIIIILSHILLNQNYTSRELRNKGTQANRIIKMATLTIGHFQKKSVKLEQSPQSSCLCQDLLNQSSQCLKCFTLLSSKFKVGEILVSEDCIFSKRLNKQW